MTKIEAFTHAMFRQSADDLADRACCPHFSLARGVRCAVRMRTLGSLALLVGLSAVVFACSSSTDTSSGGPSPAPSDTVTPPTETPPVTCEDGKYRTAADAAKSVRGAGAAKHLRGKGPAVLAALDAVAERHGATCAQIALAWIMAKPAIAGPIASATSVAQITELMGALQVTLAAADVAALDRASA